MITLSISLTLFFLLLPLYVYIGYPLLLILIDKIKQTPPIKKDNITPSVTLLISCYNEINVIEKKIINCLSINYPKDKIDFIFISDASDDGTDEVISRYKDKGIKLICQQERKGKTSGLNLAIQFVNSDIIVFSDANAIYDSEAIKLLVRNFNDPSVGYVVGAALYSDKDFSNAGNSENKYWDYELFIKNLESNISSVVGGDGAIYAIRSNLYQTLDTRDINDFVNPLHIILKGYRGIFEPKARCFEETAGNFSKEAKRKVRIVNRSFWGLMKNISVLNPFKTGIFSFQIFSHKLLRWLIPFFLIIGEIGIIYLSYQNLILFQILFLLSILFLWICAIGFYFQNSRVLPIVFSYPYYFLIVNISSFLGIIKAIKGNIQVTWESNRSSNNNNNINQVINFFVMLALILSIFILHNIVYKILNHH